MRTNLPNLLVRGPNQTTAFLPDPDIEGLAETLVAFANADGGTMLVGITQGGELTGDVLALTKSKPKLNVPYTRN